MGSRTLPMTDLLCEVLEKLPQPQSTEDFVLPWRHPMTLTRAFSRFVRALGLKDLRFHDLRHDAASTLTMAGRQQATIMAVLGHRDPRMTMRYQHLAPEHLREAMAALDRAGRAALHATSEGTISAPAASERSTLARKSAS
jgi:integrase